MAGGPSKLYRIFRHLIGAGDFLRPTSPTPGRLTTVGADDEETTSEVETASGNTSETASEAETIDK